MIVVSDSSAAYGKLAVQCIMCWDFAEKMA